MCKWIKIKYNVLLQRQIKLLFFLLCSFMALKHLMFVRWRSINVKHNYGNTFAWELALKIFSFLKRFTSGKVVMLPRRTRVKKNEKSLKGIGTPILNMEKEINIYSCSNVREGVWTGQYANLSAPFSSIFWKCIMLFYEPWSILKYLSFDVLFYTLFML